jgi:hypothetical protein
MWLKIMSLQNHRCDFEPGGREFESLRARKSIKNLSAVEHLVAVQYLNKSAKNKTPARTNRSRNRKVAKNRAYGWHLSHRLHEGRGLKRRRRSLSFHLPLSYAKRCALVHLEPTLESRQIREYWICKDRLLGSFDTLGLVTYHAGKSRLPGFGLPDQLHGQPGGCGTFTGLGAA